MGTKTATKLFALTPRPNFQWRFITINEKALRALTGIRSEHAFGEIFDLTKYRFLTDNDAMFTNQISTDGYAVHFQLVRASKKESIDLKLEAFSMSEMEEYFSVCSIDPGRKHVFTASYGYGEDEHETRRVSRKEYSAFIGSKNRTRALQKIKKANGIEKLNQDFRLARLPPSIFIMNMLHILFSTWIYYLQFIQVNMLKQDFKICEEDKELKKN
ncbi:hypothetical protein VTP01DRAFT_698 [Rhizomucor pusillus]|uniref:uncharacterized protein n=1 Tax=Rhizomucor pusillus TaxID=4840 RepID=UPI003743C76C